jgi:hypothetical protein
MAHREFHKRECGNVVYQEMDTAIVLSLRMMYKILAETPDIESDTCWPSE